MLWVVLHDMIRAERGVDLYSCAEHVKGVYMPEVERNCVHFDDDLFEAKVE